ncbi:MAG: undecaprenyl-diphosphate phosphatase [Oscillospiraceae bacterium]|nr:undecaprenyl-diphosphate phosphatase [Oscillospiraceae bacterium]
MEMSVLLSIFLGLVQGITEFLPVSSSGHLSILQNLIGLKYNGDNHLFFDCLLHLATLISICIVYWSEIKAMVVESIAFIKGDGGRTDEGRMAPSVRMVFLIIVGTLPLFLLVPFFDKVESLYYKTAFIGFALLVTGTLLFVADRLPEGKKGVKTAKILDVVIIGIAQAIATIPGLSRSGTTISVGMARGLNRKFAAKFSFLLSIPAVLGSNILSLLDALKAGIRWNLMPVYLIGMIFACVSGVFAIRLVESMVSKARFGKFSYYCWAVGLIAILLSIIL